VAAQLESASATPDGFEERREKLDRDIVAAQAAHRDATDKLAEAQTRYRDADKAQRLAHEALSGVREQMGRIDERMKGLVAQRHQIERQVQEILQIDAAQTAAEAGIKPQDQLPQENAVEQKVER